METFAAMLCSERALVNVNHEDIISLVYLSFIVLIEHFQCHQGCLHLWLLLDPRRQRRKCLLLAGKIILLELNEKIGVANCFRDMCATSPMVAKLCEMPKISETKPTLDKKQTDGPYSDYVAC